MIGAIGTKNNVKAWVRKETHAFAMMGKKEVEFMQPVIHNLTINLDKPTIYNNVIIKMGDNRSRRLVFNIISNNQRVSPEDVDVIAIKAVHQQGTILHDTLKKENGKFYYDLEEDFATAEGESEIELEIISSGGSVLYSPTQYVTIKNGIYDTEKLVSENNIKGIQAYVSAAYDILRTVRDIENRFGITYGTFEEIIKELEASKGDYVTFLENLKKKVEEGYFNGAQGRPGENGADAVVAEGFGIIGFQIVDGNLHCYYFDQDPPPMEMDSRGHLIYRMEDKG